MARPGTSGPSAILVLATLTALAGCSQDYSPDIYASSAAQQASKVEQGVVIGVRGVAVSASGAAGAITGGAAGGILGAQAPGGSVGTAFGALGGTVIGGLVGSSIEHGGGDTRAFEYVVRKRNGDLLSVTQRDPAPLDIGQHVLLIAGSQARIVADYTVPIDVAPIDVAPIAVAPIAVAPIPDPRMPAMLPLDPMVASPPAPVRLAPPAATKDPIAP